MNERSVNTTLEQIHAAVVAGVIPAHQQVYIHFDVEEFFGLGAGWNVYGFTWSDRWPIVEGRSKTRQLMGAQAVAKLRCGITDWRKNALGDYVPTEVDRRFPITKQGHSLKELRKEAKR